MIVLVLGQCGRARASAISTLHQFINRDGANPCATLTLSGTNLYGTSFNSGPGFYGTVFRLNVDGTGFTNLHNFNGLDGANPSGVLMVTADAIYGTTQYSDSSGIGAIFKMGLDGSGFTNLHVFFDTNGAAPSGQLVLVSNVLYGTAQEGGAGDSGTVFSIQTDGSGFTNIYNFGSMVSGTNSDGASPFGGLVRSGNCLFGAAAGGGSMGNGTIFRLNLDGSGFMNLHNFGGLVSATNTDGALPYGTLVLDGDVLYGTAEQGGTAGRGTVFRISTNGTDFACLHYFTGTQLPGSNNFGAYPFSRLVLSAGALYGTTADSTIATGPNNGTIYQLSTDGSFFDTIYRFSALVSDGSFSVKTNREGAYPRSGLTAAEKQLFGTGWSGGTAGAGTVFSVVPSPIPVPLSIAQIGSAAILTWANPFFQLQCAPAISDVFTNVAAAKSPYTNMIGSRQQFYRLIAP